MASPNIKVGGDNQSNQSDGNNDKDQIDIQIEQAQAQPATNQQPAQIEQQQVTPPDSSRALNKDANPTPEAKENKEAPKVNESNIELEENNEKERIKSEQLAAKRLASIDTYLNWGIFTGWCVSIYCMFIWWVGLIGLVICAAMFTAFRALAFKVVAKYDEKSWKKYNLPILIMTIICFAWYAVVFIYLLEELIRQSTYKSYTMTNILKSKLKVFYPMITSVIGIYLVLIPTFVLQLLALLNYRRLPFVIVKDEGKK